MNRKEKAVLVGAILKKDRKEIIEDKYHAAIRRGKAAKLQISKLMEEYPLWLRRPDCLNSDGIPRPLSISLK